MNQTNRIYKNNILLSITILMCIHVINVTSEVSSDDPIRNVTVSLHSHKNDSFDITTMYRLTKHMNKKWSILRKGFENENVVLFTKRYHSYFSFEIHSRTNAIGMPIIIGNEIITNFPRNNSNMNVNFDFNYWRNSSITLSGAECVSSDTTHDTSTYSYLAATSNNTDNRSNQCYDALEYMYWQQYYSDPYYVNYVHQSFLTVNWTPDKDENSLAVTYYHRMNSQMEIIMSISDDNGTLITSSTLDKYNDIITLKVTNLYLLKNKTYEIIFKKKYVDWNGNHYYDNYGNWFGLVRIFQYKNDDEDVKMISIDELGDRQRPFNILGQEYIELPRSTGDCLNGGYIHHSTFKCSCPPGFKGEFCEIGCGPNLYGADCKGICSMYADKMCRGIFMCTNYGCTCPAGLTGPLCEDECTFGNYGAHCTQTCSVNCYHGKCDAYTGVCSQGCLPGYIPPYCTEKYPYLINPPTLISKENERLVFKIDFQSNNLKGRNNTEIKYFQLLYKSQDEDQFTNSEIKFISDNNTEITEILSNLKPDTVYLVGALVITDEGNFNDKDIVYGAYRTSCIQPQITDYNITLTSGRRKINITWNKMTPKQLECKVTQYILTLSFNQSLNKIAGVQEIVSSSDGGHIIDNLIPGYQYTIVLTPKTNQGSLLSSPPYKASPLLLSTENDVAVNNIVTTTDDEKIKVSWKLMNSRQPDNTVNVPAVTFIVKYKINRILSCSLKEVENNNWTTTTVYNRTYYEIFDTIPNSQYCIQIAILQDKYTIGRENIVYALTSASKPKTEPFFDIERPIYVTNNSVYVQWKFDPVNCSKLNGFFSNYFVELKDTYNSIVQTNETKKNYIYIDGLQSRTSYKLKIFIKTHIGYNHEHFLFANFTTKIGNLMSVDNLVVYKKSLKYRMVGLRWSYSETENVDGFITSFNTNVFTNATNTSTIPPTKCSAWPNYYCHTFYNLGPNYNYTFTIQPKTLEYPQGGKTTTISFNMSEEMPESPSNIKITETGKNYLTLQWDIPWMFNGALNGFVINVEEISATDMSKCCSSIVPIEIPFEEEMPSYNYTIMDLKPGSTYSIGIILVTKSFWYSSPARIYATTDLDYIYGL